MVDLTNLKLNNVEFFERNGELYGEVKSKELNACYELKDVTFQRPAEGILMDLDGTTLDSEGFWIYIIQTTIAKLTGDPKFTLEDADEPFVSGYTTVEHLRYCINKYCKDKKIEDANAIYHITASEELEKVMNGAGNANAFRPNDGLKEFLLEVKRRGIKIGLATSGLKYKAIPEIVSVFRQLDMGDPLKFYDSIITGGDRKNAGVYGTVGEIASKPHPFIYSELAHLGLNVKDDSRVLGIEDSSAGVLSLRFAGFPVVGLNTGNISKSGLDGFCYKKVDNLTEILEIL